MTTMTRWIVITPEYDAKGDVAALKIAPNLYSARPTSMPGHHIRITFKVPKEIFEASLVTIDLQGMTSTSTREEIVASLDQLQKDLQS